MARQINRWTDQRSRRIPDTDEPGPCFNLGLAELRCHVEHELKKIDDELGVVKEVEHHGVNPAQIGGCGARTLYPSFNEFFAARASM
jgi:hypothetical protein